MVDAEVRLNGPEVAGKCGFVSMKQGLFVRESAPKSFIFNELTVLEIFTLS